MLLEIVLQLGDVTRTAHNLIGIGHLKTVLLGKRLGLQLVIHQAVKPAWIVGQQEAALLQLTARVGLGRSIVGP